MIIYLKNHLYCELRNGRIKGFGFWDEAGLEGGSLHPTAKHAEADLIDYYTVQLNGESW